MAGVRRGVGKGLASGGALISRMLKQDEVPVKICIPGLPRPL